MLIEADESQKQARDRLTASVWGKGLTTETFLAREAALRAHPFAAKNMRTWLWLSPKAAPDSVLSSCETFEVRAFRDGRVGRAFIVASVFTEPSLRGKGHAVAMLEALSKQLSAEPGAIAVVLFSEVGASLYRRAGFTLIDTHDVIFDAQAGDVSNVQSVESVSGFFAPGHGVRLELSQAQAEWHLERERFYAKALHRAPPPAHRGRLGESELCVVASFQTNELHVLWYRFNAPDDVEPLVRWAASEAKRGGFARVRFWETAPFQLPSGALRIPRLDELAMIRPLDGGSSDWSGILRGSWA
jgi:GNAT superfamily N-acetyltransferase